MTPQDIASKITGDILSGTLPPGTPLSQSDLADRFGVSRIPVRDALAQLAADGVIIARPNRTATVLEMSRAEVIEAYDLRLLLEGDLLARALPLMTAEDWTRIDYALARSSLEARQSNWADGDRMFHDALYAPADRPRQMAMVHDLRVACRIQIAAYGQLTQDTDRWLDDHTSIADACRAGDAAIAARLLRRHLKAARNLLLRAMGPAV